MKKDISDMEMAIQRSEQEKKAKDHTIKNLNEEIAIQDEAINKLNSEKWPTVRAVLLSLPRRMELCAAADGGHFEA